MGAPEHAGWICEFIGQGIRFWSGDSDAVIGGKTYRPGHFISIQHAANETGTPNRRATASFAVTDPAVRAALLQDEGPTLIEVQFVHSADRGRTWRIVGNRHIGRLSSPLLRDGAYSVEIETYRGDVDRGRPAKWSHERQSKRGGGGDLAFEMAAQLASGVETRWPP